MFHSLDGLMLLNSIRGQRAEKYVETTRYFNRFPLSALSFPCARTRIFLSLDRSLLHKPFLVTTLYLSVDGEKEVRRKMKIKISALVNFLLGVVLVVSIAANLTGAVNYDPWLDVTDDGYGGIDDIVSTAEHFGASGDPIKNVNVTNWPSYQPVGVQNWPEHPGVGVWFGYHLPPSSSVGSVTYGMSYFGRLHILARGNNLGAIETLTITIYGRLYNLDHSAYNVIPVYSFTLNQASSTIAFSIPVPSPSVYFLAETDSSTDCLVYLAFHLTYA